MSLKKPTEFFGKNNNKKEEVTTSLPENLGEYKSNLKNIEVLNEFTENFGSFADNITKINTLEEGIQELKEELKNTLTQEDLDNAVMSNLLILEKNIDNIQKSLKGINRENLKNIYEEVENISNQVSLVTEELPRYKNLIKSNEVYLDKKLIQYQESVNENLTDFSNFIDNKFDVIEQSIEDNIENYQEQIQLKIQEVQQSFETLFENEVPKYQSLLANAKIENDKKVESIVNKLTHKIKALAENTLKLNEELEDKSNVLDQAFETKISALESYILNAKKEAEETTQTYRKLYQVIEAKGLSDRSQFDTYEKAISHISSQFSSVYEKIEETKKEIEKKELYQEELNNIQESFNQKFIQVETLIENKNQKLKEANEVLVDNIISLKEEVSKISVSELHQNYQQISRKVNYIEEVFSKFNEKTILNEGLLNEPPEIKTKDPLTPLDQNFVTLDQLQSHYRLFINRIQQQLSTIGGGGETRLEFLDDVDRDSAKTDGYVLSYRASTGKFIGTAVSGGGSQTLDTTLGLGNTSSLGMSVGVVTATSFSGSGTALTGIVTSIIAGTNITVSGSTGQVTINASGGGGGSSQWVTTDVGIHTLSNVGIGTTNPTSKLHVVGDARITGILTIGTSSIVLDGTDNKIYVGSGVTISSTEISIGSNIIGSGGFSGNASSATFATSSGIATFATNAGIATYATNAGVSTYADNAGIATSVIGGIVSVTQLNVSGISTFTNGPVLVGTATSTGTASQPLQVTGGAYVSGNLGIGTTNPTSKLHVVGDVRVSGVVTATTFVGALTGTATSTTNIPNLTGAITSNNTTTSLGSFTSAQLATALTDETGSGAAVFATSPTLVTPSLGAATATSIVVSSGSTFTNGPILVGAATSTGTALQILQVTGGAYVSGSVGIGTTNPTSKLQVQGDVSVVGIITATQFSTGASGTGVNISTDTISGPSLLYIDPAAVGDNTGAVRIKGDLYVDGTQFIVNSTTIEFADFNVGIATTVGTNALLDGAGIGIGSTGIRKTLTWNNNSTALKSSEDFDVASGKVYKINGTSVLSNNTLGSDIVTSSLTSVGTLTNLSVGNVYSSGIVTATSFTGSGTNLTGIVTSIIAGTNVTISGSTGQVTINASGGGGSSQWITTDVGIHTLSNVGIGTTNPTSKLTVVGVVSATSFSGSGIGLTSIPAGQLTGALPAIDGSALTGIVAGGSGVVIRDDGSPVGTAGTIDFGANLSVSFASGIATITASGGGSQTLDTTLGLGNTSSLGMSVGVVTATSFSGSGTNLTGIVTSIIAGTNITVSGSTGQVTINASGGGGSSVALDLLEVMLFT